MALAETAMAVSVAIYVYSEGSHFAYVIAISALAPAVLLQTEPSNQRALRYAGTLVRWFTQAFYAAFPKQFPQSASVDKSTSFRRLILLGTIFLALEIYIAILYIAISTSLVVSILAARTLAVLFEVKLSPAEAIAAIPDNWRKIVLCTDATTLPELVPGLEALPSFSDLFILRFADAARDLWLGRARQAAGLTYILMFIYLPASLYRWSIKSTSLIWSPLLWAFRPIQINEDALQLAKRIQFLTIYKISRIYSAVVLILFSAKLYLIVAWASIRAPFERLPGWDTIAHYLVPEAIPGWHVAAAINAALTWLIFFKAERYTFDSSMSANAPDSGMRNFFASSFAIRNLLTIYTTACTIYITFSLVGAIDISKVRVIGFPW